MPGLLHQPRFKTITVKQLHPTFGAEIQGVDFDNVSDEQFDEVKAALAKVSERETAHGGNLYNTTISTRWCVSIVTNQPAP